MFLDAIIHHIGVFNFSFQLFVAGLQKYNRCLYIDLVPSNIDQLTQGCKSHVCRFFCGLSTYTVTTIFIPFSNFIAFILLFGFCKHMSLSLYFQMRTSPLMT